MTRPPLRGLLAAGLLPLLAGCAAPAPSAPPAPGIIRSVEPWEGGQLVRTPRFAIAVTDRSEAIAARLPAFFEAALDRCLALADLPPPPGRLEVFLFADRDAFIAHLRPRLGDAFDGLDAVERGGLTYRGRAYLHALDPDSTFTLAAHETWHLYAQRTFAAPLPTWLDEALATFMEGHAWDRQRPRFEPARNPERAATLAALLAARRDLPLAALLDRAPVAALADGPQAVLDYYAQVWALGLYLHDADGGRLRPALRRLLQDAASGRPPAAPLPTDSAPRPRSALFLAYFGGDLPTHAAAYREFCRSLTPPEPTPAGVR